MASRRNSTIIEETAKSEDDTDSSIISDLIQQFHVDGADYEIYPGTERDIYDFAAERHNVQPSNLIESTGQLIKGCIGAGVLSIHEGFMYGGLWTSLVTTVVIAIILSYNMTILIKSAHKMYVLLRVPTLSYPNLMEVAVAIGPMKKLRRFSKYFRYFVDICLISEMCGSCCIYEIIISKTLKQVLEAVSPTMDSQAFPIRIYLLIIMVPLILVSSIQNLRCLVPFSFIVDIIVGSCVVITIYHVLPMSNSISDLDSWKSFHGLVRFCGICIYSLEGVSITLPVENNMAKPRYFNTMIHFGMAIVVVIITATGFLGYWGWGDNARSPITIDMPMNKTFLIVLQFLMVAAVSFAFAVNFWVPFKIAWHYIGKFHKRDHGFWERFYRVIHVVLITCLALTFPGLTDVMIFIGNVLVSIVALILPAFIDSLVMWNEQRRSWIRWSFIINVVVICMGFTLMVATLHLYCSES